MKAKQKESNEIIKAPSSSKDKTPMCLINELARYNKIQHQYRLTKEEGPPHNKKFTVTLKLADTEFEAEGTSIKKAQHEAAAIALKTTKYEHPPSKLLPNPKVNTTPTVQLNALAMKRGESTIYTMLSPTIQTYYHPQECSTNYHATRTIYQNRNFYEECFYNNFIEINDYSLPIQGLQHTAMRYNNVAPFKISLKVGTRGYITESATTQKSHHNAIRKELDLVNPSSAIQLSSLTLDRCEPTIYTMLNQPIQAYYHQQESPNYYTSRNIYQRYNGTPPFKISLKVGNREYIAEGTTAQKARHNAAKKALEDLDFLQDNCYSNDNENYDDEPSKFNNTIKSPISSVYENAFKYNLQATFEVVDERGPPHIRIFITECRVGNMLKTIGEGNGKKTSKRKAAEKMLELLQTIPVNNFDKHRIKRKSNTNKNKCHVKNSYYQTNKEK